MVTTSMMALPKEQKSRNYMLVKSSQKWFENEVKETGAQVDKLSRTELDPIHQYATQLLAHEKELYQKHLNSRKKRSDFGWMQTVLKSGTIADRMAAMTLLIQDSPVHNLHYIKNLIDMVTVKGKRECLMSIDTLRDLFLADLLLQHRKLKTFSEHSFSSVLKLSKENRDLMDKQLLLWIFEDELKRHYASYVDALDAVSRDVVESTKTKAVRAMFELLVSNPENEQVLLKKLINKLGDPKHKVAAFSVQKLNQIINQHPNMKRVMVVEVEHLLFRPNIAPRARYYGICFLNQLILSEEDKDLALHLISIYFSFFKACVKKSDIDTKMMSALLTGVNRAFPFTKGEIEKIEEQIDTMFRIVHSVKFQIGMQALMLIYHVLDAKQAVSDRFYSALYRKLLDPEMKNSTRLASFFNLLFKSLRIDDNVARLQAFVKRLLQISQTLNAPIVCAILILISEIVKNKSRAILLEQQMALNADDDDEHFQDVALDSENVSDTEGQTSAISPVKDIDIKQEDVKDPNLTSFVANSQKWKLASSDYDPLKRNPAFANAGLTCTWELLSLRSHCHPTVALFASTLLEGNDIFYTGDPLQDFTLIRFLDRFVYRNPKAATSQEVDTKKLVFGRRKLYKPAQIRQTPANSLQFISNRKKFIPVDETFLYDYFSQQKEKLKQRSKDDSDSDVESVASDEFDEYLSKHEFGQEDDLDDLDFSSALSSKKKSGKRKQNTEDSDEDDDFEEELEEDEDYNDAFKDFDSDIEEAKTAQFDEEMAFPSDESDSEEEHEAIPERKGKRGLEKMDVKGFKKFKGSRSEKVDIADADEFAEIMDDYATSKFDTISTNALANKDNADVKQLKWEMNRDRWVRDANRKKKFASMKTMKGKRGKTPAVHRKFKSKRKVR